MGTVAKNKKPANAPEANVGAEANLLVLKGKFYDAQKTVAEIRQRVEAFVEGSGLKAAQANLNEIAMTIEKLENNGVSN